MKDSPVVENFDPTDHRLSDFIACKVSDNAFLHIEQGHSILFQLFFAGIYCLNCDKIE